MNELTITKSFPAYDVATRAPVTGLYYKGAYRADITFTNISNDDRLCFGRQTRNHGIVHGEFYTGSVVSYAMKKGEDPIEAIERARANNHQLHWISAAGASLTAHKRDRWTMIELELGMIVKFEGLLFTIASAPNDNLSLVPFAV